MTPDPAGKIFTGVDKGWIELAGLDPAGVCKRTLARHDGSGYVLRFMDLDLNINYTNICSKK